MNLEFAEVGKTYDWFTLKTFLKENSEEELYEFFKELPYYTESGNGSLYTWYIDECSNGEKWFSNEEYNKLAEKAAKRMFELTGMSEMQLHIWW